MPMRAPRATLLACLFTLTLAGSVSAGVLQTSTAPAPLDEARSCMASCLDDESLDETDVVTCVLNCRETVERTHDLDECRAGCVAQLGEHYLECASDERGSDEFTCRLQSDNVAGVCWDDCSES